MPTSSSPDNLSMSATELTSRKAPLDVLQNIFPELQQNELETITELKMALRLKRNFSPLIKPVVWRTRPTEPLTNEGLKMYLRNAADTARSLGPEWAIEKLDVIPIHIARDWSRGVRLANHQLWMEASSAIKSNASALYTAPTTVAAPKKERGFTVDARVVVVNPARPSEVWQVSDTSIVFPNNYAQMAPRQQSQWWADYLAENQDVLMQEFGLDALPRVLRPSLLLRWNVYAPDGASAYDDTHLMSTPWNKNSAAVGWINHQKERIEAAYDKAAQWAVWHAMNVYNQQHEALVAANESTDVDQQDVDWAAMGQEIIAEEEWDLFDQQAPNTAEQFDAMMKDMRSSNPHGFKRISEMVVNAALEATVKNKSTWKSHAWLILPYFRQWFDDRPWASNDLVELFVAEERSAVRAACAREKNWPAYVEDLSAPDKEFLAALLAWNDCSVDDEIWTSMLDADASNNSVLLSTKTAKPEIVKGVADILSPTLGHKEVVEMLIGKTPAQKIPDNASVSDMDWSALLKAFDVDLDTAAARPAHPFSNWMERLAPPSEVKQATQKWLVDNERFNDINRLILRKKDADEASLNTDLVSKLKNVMEVSNSILEDNQRSGGWWGRVRKNFATTDATPEKWADVFLDFQNHMLLMFDTINKQVERDRVWLKYADQLGVSAQQVDTQWSGWLAATAKTLTDEHNQNTDNSLTSEKKIEWNNRADLLDSAQVAHEHIKTANGITVVLLEKVRQSTAIKERMQQRSMMFYWSSLNMFAGLQSLQRNTNAIFEQSEMVEAMSRSFEAMATRSVREEAEQKEKLREAFRKMSESEQAMKQFHESIVAFQNDAVQMLGDLNLSRETLQEESIAATLSPQSIKQQRAKKMSVSVDGTSENPRADKPRTSSTGGL